MKRFGFLSLLLAVICVILVHGQSGFNLVSYAGYLETNSNMTYKEMSLLHPTGNYFQDMQVHVMATNYEYFDTISEYFKLTTDEIGMLEKNKFMVTERLSFGSILHALDSIYELDLPVFVSTDCILEAIHRSYDLILNSLENDLMITNLQESLKLMANKLGDLQAKYWDTPELRDALCDVELYLTVARSLLDHTTHTTTMVNQGIVDGLLSEIYQEQMVVRPLFSERDRMLDFSQFTPRGHYISDWYEEGLEEYFRTMMWLGRIDFFLTPPPIAGEPPWSREEIRRMNLGAYLLQELLESSGARTKLEENERIIRFMVGEADNLTPFEYGELIRSIPTLTNAKDLLSDEVYDYYYEAMSNSLLGEQKILSSLFISDPMDPNPMELPVSYRLFGQRFTVDSYIFSNVVFDRIIYQGEKIYRMMPDPLDAMFVLGNNNAGELLKEEIETYSYASQLNALKYLVDAFDEEFWTESLYNTWLNSIRQLNPSFSGSEPHYFMKTVAWQQQKLNTQLASWAQLRHDNLLYAKQSYTGVGSCLFPHSFVEPYPEFYRKIGQFCDAAQSFFSDNLEEGSQITSYFNTVRTVMEQLTVISEKELNLEKLTEDEVDFLKSMLHPSEWGGCGATLQGWLPSLYYGAQVAPRLSNWETNYVIADVHTQPSDELGNIIGKVMHVGSGKVNLGIFLVDQPSDNNVPTAYIGPFQSYYEHFTFDFDRKTDEWWTNYIESKYPSRPDWTRVYLADINGNTLSGGRKLKGSIYVAVDQGIIDKSSLFVIFPNPVTNELSIQLQLQADTEINLELYDASGRLTRSILTQYMSAGKHIITYSAQDLTPGLYLILLNTGQTKTSAKFLKE